MEVVPENVATRGTARVSHIGAVRKQKVADFQLGEAPVVVAVAVEMEPSVIRCHIHQW